MPTLTLTGNDIGNNNGAAVDTAVSNTLEITGNNVHDNQGGGIFAGGTPTPTVSVLQNNFVANEQDGLSINGPAPQYHFNRFFLNETASTTPAPAPSTPPTTGGAATLAPATPTATP